MKLHSDSLADMLEDKDKEIDSLNLRIKNLDKKVSSDDRKYKEEVSRL